MPGRLKIRTTGQYRQDGGRWYLLDQQIQEFQGRGVCPVQVFQDKEDRLRFSQLQENGDDGFQGLLALPLRGERQRRIAVLGEGHREQRREKLNRFFQGK